MNRKGFTLIELLATIVLLAIIVGIAIPAVNSVMAKNKQKNCKNLSDSFVKAAELYVSDNKYKLNWYSNIDGERETVVKYSDLYNINLYLQQRNQYLSTPIVNPCNNEEYRTDFSIKFVVIDGNIKLKSENVLPLDDFDCCY